MIAPTAVIAAKIEPQKAHRQNHGHTQPARPMPNEGHCKVHQTPRDTGLEHHEPGKNKKWDSEEDLFRDGAKGDLD
jgi:hypothetical protein